MCLMAYCCQSFLVFINPLHPNISIHMSGIANINSLVIKQTKSYENVIYWVNQNRKKIFYCETFH